MHRILRTPILVASMASLSLFAFACGDDDDGNGLEPLPTVDETPTAPGMPEETPTIDTGDPGNGNGTADPGNGEGVMTGSISASGEVEGEFAPTSALATATGELQALLSSEEGDSAVLMIAPDGSVSLDALAPDLGTITFSGDGAAVTTDDSGMVICAVTLADTELTSDNGDSVNLDGELTVSGGVC